MSAAAMMTFISMAALLPAGAGAESPAAWSAKTFDLGTFHEEKGRRHGEVVFVNRSAAPLMIDRVKASCGCTEVKYGSDPVNPGDSATISFSYNPIGRPGRFDKTLRVYMVGHDEPDVIHITGNVVPSQETLRYNYPEECGPLRLSTAAVDAGNIHPGATRHIFVSAYNQGDADITPAFHTSDSRVKVSFSPETLRPGETGNLIVQILVPKGDEGGSAGFPVTVSPYSVPTSPHITVNISGEISGTAIHSPE